MPSDAGDSTSASAPVGLTPRTRATILWSAIALLLLLAFAAAVGALQRDVYSASGFVTGYVDALGRHDARAALAMPGVEPTRSSLIAAGLPVSASQELLRSDLLADVRDVHVLHDDVLAGDVHQVTVALSVDGTHVTTAFRVEQTSSILGILPLWRFARTPLAVAAVTVEHADTFTIGGHTVSTRATRPTQPTDTFATSADYLVFAPGHYRLGHASTFLTAFDTSVVVAKPDASQPVTVVATPNAKFTKTVATQVDSYLDACAKQQVLQPSGCPFGVQIDDRVQGLPTWSMVTYPAIDIIAGPNGWQGRRAGGTVHLTVSIQSLFDGSMSTRDSDEPFTMSLSSITVRPDGAVDIVVGD